MLGHVRSVYLRIVQVSSRLVRFLSLSVYIRLVQVKTGHVMLVQFLSG
jgi:hypothetical protein